MENKTPNLMKKISLLIFTIINMAMAQKSLIPVRVGVVLDMDHYIGQMGFSCITMALSDFYGTHSYYKTRLVLNIRDSKRDVVGAAAAALDLLKNEEVQAVMGPLSSTQADFLINLGDKAHVPVITFSATNPSLSSIRSPYFIRAALDDSSQVRAISSILQAFGWRQVLAIYEDNEFGKGIIPFLTDALEQVNVHFPYKSAISPLATDDQIDAELYKLMTMQTRVFVVHMLPRLGTRLFAKAKALGMMSGDYAWIVTDGMTYELNSIHPSVMESMLGVIGVQPYIPKTEQLDTFTIRYRKRFQHNNLNIFGLWAYDSAIALAMAVEKAMITNNSFLKTNTLRNSTDLEGFGVSSAGKKIIEALSSITVFGGLSGDFELIDGQLESPPYQIINVVGTGARVVGYWTKKNGIVRKLSFTGANTYSTSKSNIESIIWPGDKTSPPKGWVIPTNGKKLRIGVPVNDVYGKFVQLTLDHKNLTQVEGYCIDVFDEVVKALPYGIQYEYVPFVTSDHKSSGSYNDLIYQVYLENFDAVVGDVTIIANRSQYVDFTLPFTESGVSMVVPIKYDKRKNAWVFLTPLTWELWLTIFFSFIVIGFLIWVLEHRVNEDFRGPLWHQVGTILWFSFSTMVFAQKERVTSNLARFVMIIWFLVVLILTQSYTASLASMLTVQRLQPTVTDVNELIRNNENVAYLNGSFVFGLLKEMGFQESRLLAYNSSDELDELLSKGTTNGGVAAVFDEIPYMKLFLAMHCSKYTMVGPTYKTGGFGFNFDAVVGDVTIIANRSQYVDFTLPFTESGVSMVVPIKYDKRKNAWVFLTPLTWELWLTIFFSFIVIGFLIWVLEHRVNEDFRGPLWHQVGTILWFSFSTMVFAQKERVTSNLARFVMIIWFLVVLILTQSYTASLASMLTVQRLQPTVTDVNELIRNNENVAYLNGSFVFGLLKDMDFQESRLLAYNSSDELDELLSKGSINGGVAAVFDEIPYMKLFLAKHCSNYTMVGPTYKTGGFGFAFPIGSPLVHDISRAILEVTERKTMVAVDKKWLGKEIECPDSSTLLSSDNIGLESFWGLFLIVIIASVLAFVIYVVKFMHENWHVMDHSDPGSTIWSKVVELFRRFNNKDFNSRTFKRAMKSSSEQMRPIPSRPKKEPIACETFVAMHREDNGKFVDYNISEHADDPDMEINENEVYMDSVRVTKGRSSFQPHKSRVTPIETRQRVVLPYQEQREQLQAYQQEERERCQREEHEARARERIELEDRILRHVEQQVAATMARYASQSQQPASHPLE